mmetsp:Transcript_11284/g.27599  ORF Transcript_11284/g.27599 Transcript_11284/m.27599 type:complete len:115 (-) Transcript_11284:553-897(-)
MKMQHTKNSTTSSEGGGSCSWRKRYYLQRTLRPGREDQPRADHWSHSHGCRITLMPRCAETIRLQLSVDCSRATTSTQYGLRPSKGGKRKDEHFAKLSGSSRFNISNICKSPTR